MGPSLRYPSCLGLQISGIVLNTQKVCKASLEFRGLGCNTPVEGLEPFGCYQSVHPSESNGYVFECSEGQLNNDVLEVSFLLSSK